MAKTTKKTKKKASKKTTTKTKKTIASKKTTKKKTTRKASKKKSSARIVDAELVEEISASQTSKALTHSDPVTTYLAEIRKYPLLDKEEEKALALKYHDTKDPAIAEILVTSNLRFVVKIAAEYAKFGAKLIDLIQEGNVGLMHAVKEFNPYKGVRLISYAVWWIRGYIQEYMMRQYSMVRIGTTQSQRKLFYQLKKEREKLEQEGVIPTNEILSDRLGVAEKDIKLMTQRLSGRDVSLDQPIDSESDSRLMDFQTTEFEPGIDEQLGEMELLEKLLNNIEKVKPNLNERETYLLENRMLADQPLTLQEVGDHYGITREAVRQMETRLMNKIKDVFLEDIIPQSGQVEKSEIEENEIKDIN